MLQSSKLYTAGLLLIVTCGVLSMIYGLRGSTDSSAPDDHLNGQRPLQPDDSLRLDSWGECFQSAPSLFVAAASVQADHAGRSHVRRQWRKWRVPAGTAQLMFFLRYSESASRWATVDEFHANQDVIVDSKLDRQDDLAMLQSAVAWFLDRCPRTPYLLFASHGAAPNPRLVALHATGGVASGAAARLPLGLQVAPAGNGTGQRPPAQCLLLERGATAAAQRLRRSVTSWQELLAVGQFNASVRDATRLLCS